MKKKLLRIVPLLFAAVCVYYFIRSCIGLSSFIGVCKLCFYAVACFFNIRSFLRPRPEESTDSVSFQTDICVILDFLVVLLALFDILVGVASMLAS